MRIVVGTTALKEHGIKYRAPKDVDVFVDDINDIQPNDDYIMMPSSIMGLIPCVDGYATPDAVYTIKCSHLGWDSHDIGRSPFGGSTLWDKHKRDVLALSTFCEIIPSLFNALTDHWRCELGNKEYLNLNRSKDEFFNDHVEYKYDHDELHAMVSAPNEPIYKKILKDGSDVMVCKEKFTLLAFDEQVKLFQEEICTIAIERYVIHGMPALKAYNSALKKTITRLTKNWASDFITSNMQYFKKPMYNLYIE